MGIAQSGTTLAGGENLAVKGVRPSGIVVSGKTVWTVPKLIASVSAQPPTTTSPAIDTTGASLLILAGTPYLAGSGTITVTDSYSNTWSRAVQSAVGTGNVTSELWVATHPTVGSNHTFSYNNQVFGSFAVMAFRFSSSGQMDQTESIINNPTLPAILPSKSYSLIVTSAGSPNLISGISSNFNLVGTWPVVGGLAFAMGAAYAIEATAQVISPTWGFTFTNQGAATMLNFVP